MQDHALHCKKFYLACEHTYAPSIAAKEVYTGKAMPEVRSPDTVA